MRFLRGHNNRGRAIKLNRWIEEDRGYISPCWIWQLGVTTQGYGGVKRAGRQLLAHRVAYEAAYGHIPEGFEIDHGCRVKTCVNPSHLRLATRAQNAENVPGRPGTSCFRGVSWSRARGKWVAYVGVRGRTHFLGHFEREEDAAVAALAGRRRLLPFSVD